MCLYSQMKKILCNSCTIQLLHEKNPSFEQKLLYLHYINQAGCYIFSSFSILWMATDSHPITQLNVFTFSYKIKMLYNSFNKTQCNCFNKNQSFKPKLLYLHYIKQPGCYVFFADFFLNGNLFTCHNSVEWVHILI